MLFMVSVDVSKPDSCLEGLKRWLGHVRKFANQHNQGELLTQLECSIDIYDINFA